MCGICVSVPIPSLQYLENCQLIQAKSADQQKSQGCKVQTRFVKVGNWMEQKLEERGAVVSLIKQLETCTRDSDELP